MVVIFWHCLFSFHGTAKVQNKQEKKHSTIVLSIPHSTHGYSRNPFQNARVLSLSGYIFAGPLTAADPPPPPPQALTLLTILKRSKRHTSHHFLPEPASFKHTDLWINSTQLLGHMARRPFRKRQRGGAHVLHLYRHMLLYIFVPEWCRTKTTTNYIPVSFDHWQTQPSSSH